MRKKIANTIFFSWLFLWSFCLNAPLTLAADDINPGVTTIEGELQIKKPILKINIPKLNFSEAAQNVDDLGYLHLPWIGEYVTAIYKFAMVIASIIAVIVLIMQGARVIISAGGEEKNAAYKRILQAVVGLFICWGSYAILYNINPDLVQFKALKVKYIERIPLIDVINEPLDNLQTTYQQIGSLNMPDFKQFDQRWGNITYGNIDKLCDKTKDAGEISKKSNECCTSIQASGCGPTSLAIILTAYGARATPEQTSKFSGKGEEYGRVCNVGTAIGVTISKLDESPWPNFTGSRVNKEKALNLLREGRPIIFLCIGCTGQKTNNETRKYNGHYMVLSGINSEGKVLVSDPGGNKNTAIIWMNESQLDQNGGFWHVYPRNN